ncbi:hypothetical protein BT96DRAFT_979627, partial [Gymnopus androsaceus JB14]
MKSYADLYPWAQNRFRKWKAAELKWQELLDHWKNHTNPLDDKGPYPRTLEIAPKSGNASLTYTLDDCGSTVLVLASYSAMVERLFGRYQREDTNHSGVLISGQPGTGKSVFLWYLLAVLLTLKDDSPCQRAPVLFYHGVHIILFYNDRAYTPISPSTFDFTIIPEVTASNGSIWALIDVDAKTEEPTGLAEARRVFAVQAASPDPKRYHIWLERRDALKELLAGWKVQHKYTQTMEAIDYWLNHRDDPIKPEFELHLIHRTTLEEALISGRDFIHNKQEDEMVEDEYPDDTQEQEQNATEETKEQEQSVSTINPEEAAKILLSHAITQYGWAARDVYEYLHEPAAVYRSPQASAETTSGRRSTSEVVKTSIKENDEWFPIIKSDYIAGEMDQKLLGLTDEKRQKYCTAFKEMAGRVYETTVHDKI